MGCCAVGCASYSPYINTYGYRFTQQRGARGPRGIRLSHGHKSLLFVNGVQHLSVFYFCTFDLFPTDMSTEFRITPLLPADPTTATATGDHLSAFDIADISTLPYSCLAKDAVQLLRDYISPPQILVPRADDPAEQDISAVSSDVSQAWMAWEFMSWPGPYTVCTA